jgi:hypothetical protein
MLAVVTPGHFNLFFEELCSLHEGRSTPNMAGMERLAGESGIAILGPPLS